MASASSRSVRYSGKISWSASKLTSLMNLGGSADQCGQIAVQLLVAGAREQTDDGAGLILLLLDKRGVELLGRQLVEIRMADVACLDASEPVPLLLERQRTEDVVY